MELQASGGRAFWRLMKERRKEMPCNSK